MGFGKFLSIVKENEEICFMALRLRLARAGTKKRPFYRLVVAEASAPRDGRFVEKVGTYDPRLPSDHIGRVTLKSDRIQYWLSQGVKPSERVELFLAKADLVPMPKRPERPSKSAPKKKAQERLAEKLKAKEEALKAEAEAKSAATDVSKNEAEKASKDASEKPADA